NALCHFPDPEVQRYFGITELLNEKSAARIWEKANEQLATPALTTQGILKKFKVTNVCTTDDPTDDLRYHATAAKSGMSAQILPAFRPDKALTVHQPKGFGDWLKALEKASDV